MFTIRMLFNIAGARVDRRVNVEQLLERQVHRYGGHV